MINATPCDLSSFLLSCRVQRNEVAGTGCWFVNWSSVHVPLGTEEFVLRHPDKLDSQHELQSALFNKIRDRDYVLKHCADMPQEDNKDSLCFQFLRSLSVATRWRFLFVFLSQLTWGFFWCQWFILLQLWMEPFSLCLLYTYEVLNLTCCISLLKQLFFRGKNGNTYW